ncbi:LytR/AlgR family response regulator transcription factor [Spirosoma utsteinense]|uniref:DNA-binding LytR/AlgR family response regulator n=1 Tax=Spirosoma utsteinense TaxID=2585773 RepID=A0ABR6WCB0_9BACT|nr:response regulator transcription factor [Spirosoma utsteinense]MBC3783864.1 DNA-binding LytR/AlgR family response regulator [Spirosoma utsteinense]MBC3793557.1 DNA-binding LytR/AlgR family response regulator [Spirosoma utsteinense]
MKPLKILIVEDDELTVELLTVTLQQAGHSVVGVARTLAEAVRISQQQPVDLALLDVHLPGSEDGIAIARMLMQQDRIPFLFITGQTGATTLKQLKALRPVGFLSKPFSPVDLIMQIDLAIERTPSLHAPSSLLPDHLLIPDDGRLIPVRQSDIVFAEARTNFTCLFVRNRKDPFVVTDNLKNIATRLTLPSFYRVSRSYVVNLQYLAYIEGNKLFLTSFDEGTANGPRPIPIPADTRPGLLKQLTVLRAR